MQFFVEKCPLPRSAKDCSPALEEGLQLYADLTDGGRLRKAKIRRYLGSFNDNRSSILLARSADQKDHRVVGFASYHRQQHSGTSPVTSLDYLVVAPELRATPEEHGHHIGGTLLQRVLDESAAERIGRVELVARFGTEEFYKRFEFFVVGTSKRGNFMRLDLPAASLGASLPADR